LAWSSLQQLVVATTRTRWLDPKSTDMETLKNFVNCIVKVLIVGHDQTLDCLEAVKIKITIFLIFLLGKWQVSFPKELLLVVVDKGINTRLPLSNPIMFFQNFFFWHYFGNLLSFANYPHHSTIIQPNNFIMDLKIRLIGQKIFKILKNHFLSHNRVRYRQSSVDCLWTWCM
jgi:hypothetical protein